MQPLPFSPYSQVAAYLRDSGGDAQDLSVPQQEQQIRTWCETNNLSLTHIFRDEATPGSSVVGRTGFLQMIDHFTQHRKCSESGVIVWKFSRFAREIDDAQFYKADLRRRGYVIHSLNENIPQTLDGRFFESAIDWMNARFLQDLSEDVKRGLHHNIENYGAIGGIPPRGFRRGEPINLGQRRNGAPHIVHRWEPDPDLVPLVQKAFYMRAKGASYIEITDATHLYKSKTSWNHFFSNPIYIGIMKYGSHIIDNYCVPFIDQGTWQEVQMINSKSPQKRVSDVSEHPRAKSSSYVLTGLLRCGKCGAPMIGDTVHSAKKNHTNRYYACNRKKRTSGRECQAMIISADYLEMYILNEVADQILSLTNLMNIRQEALQSTDTQISELRNEINALKARQTKNYVQIDNLTEALADMPTSSSLREKLHEKERTKFDLQMQIEKLETDLVQITNLPAIDEIQDIAANVPAILRNADRTTLRTWLHELIDHIDVERGNDKLTGCIYYYMPGEFMSNGTSHQRDSNS